MTIHRFQPDFNWHDVEVLSYKENGSHFKSITRRVLFAGNRLRCDLRYFEIAAGGYSTLERHDHAHAVFILRGSGAALIGGEIAALRAFDTAEVPPLAWHQFRAVNNEPFGFLCMVNADRDRPQRPSPAELAVLIADPRIAEFIRI
jgi:quercetin dioxygenase-like cupin family protein